jgi:integrating conjugative element membrane protein (TIGR03747 family)
LGRSFRLLRWTATLCALVLVVDLACVTILWDDGVESLRDVVLAERRLLGLHANTEAGEFIDTSTALAHDWVFIKTGLGDWLAVSRKGPLAAVISSGWVVVETAILGLQLFAARLAVLILSLPLFVTIGGAAAADGLYGWLMRRTSGARESGFIYHRAKRAIPAVLMMLWTAYLVPPVEMDPRWVILPFVVIFALAMRLRVSHFKKYV